VGLVSIEQLPTCYRHPDRETRLSCSNCERPVCIDCVRTASVGQKCPECSAPLPGARTLDMNDVRRGQTRTAIVSYTILAVCVAIFVIGFVAPPLGDQLYGVQANELVADGQWWRLLTAAFFHDPSSIVHIAFNMWALYVFGPQLEREVGSAAFLALYVAAALGGGVAFYLLAPRGVAVGASGAIFGLFGAWLAASYRRRRTAAGAASLRQLLVLLGINMALAFAPGFNIAWQAHAGGLVAGFLIALAWSAPQLHNSAARRTAVAAAVAAAALTVAALG
jgi:membrane associated rhomboid family serine protease